VHKPSLSDLPRRETAPNSWRRSIGIVDVTVTREELPVAAVLRTWLGFLALGAGLLHFALVIGSPLSVALALLLIGAAEFVWGVITFVRPAPPLPMLARSGALVPVIGWALLLVIAGADSFGPLTSSAQLFPMLVASLFDLLIAVGLTVLLRRAAARRALSSDLDAASAPSSPDEPPTHAGRYLAAVFAGALVIAALATPALAATTATELSRNVTGERGSVPSGGIPSRLTHVRNSG